jgi:hypothetical protein
MIAIFFFFLKHSKGIIKGYSQLFFSNLPNFELKSLHSHFWFEMISR